MKNQVESLVDSPTADTRARNCQTFFRMGLAAIAALGFAWRLAYTMLTRRSDSNLFDEGDAFYYNFVANNLAQGNWYVNPLNGSPAADHPPLTVLVLAPAARLWSGSVLAQRLTMTVIGTLVIVAIGLLGRYLAGPRIGLVAAAVAAVNPNLWMNDAVIMSESLSALLIVATMASGVFLARRPSLKSAVLAGVVCGVTTLARAEIGLFLPLMIIPLIAMAQDLPWRRRATMCLVAALGLVAVVSPWTIWNQTRFQENVLLSTNDGTTLLGANCPEVYGGAGIGFWSLRCVLGTPVSGDASEASAQQRRIAVDYLTSNVGRLPTVVVAREGRTFGYWKPGQMVFANAGEGRPHWASWAGFVAFWVLIPPSIFGAIKLRRMRQTLMPFGAALLTVGLVSALFYGIPRFRLPLDVAMCLLTAAVVAPRPPAVGDEALSTSAASTPTN